MNIPHVAEYAQRGYHTELAATLISETIPGINGKRIMVVGLNYLCAATAHSITFLEAIGATSSVTGCRTTTDAICASGQTHLTCTDAPKDPAGNATASGDIIAYQLASGAWEFNTVASLSTKDITLGTNIAVAVPAGAKVLIFGIAADRANVKLGCAASVESYFFGNPYFVAKFTGDPIVVQSNNATNAGFLKNLICAYVEI